MGIGTSLFLIAAGAILYFAVDTRVQGLEITTVGIILMVIGILGLLISLFYTTLWARGRRDVEPPPRRPGDREYY
jgi:hypothetical protein